MSGTLRFGLTIVKLGLLFSLLTGCAPKPPAAPGTSAPLVYPVLLFTEDKLKVYKDESALTTTRAAKFCKDTSTNCGMQAEKRSPRVKTRRLS